MESDASAMKCGYAFKFLGYEKLAEKYGVRLVNLSEDRSEKVEAIVQNGPFEFMLPETIKNADLRVNVLKIKYLSHTKISCALKNIFGCNLIRWYFGEITNAKAYLGYRFNFDFEDHAICIANFISGVKAIINVSWFSQGTTTGIEVYGTAYHSTPNRIITAIQLILRKTPKYFLAYRTEILHFINCIKEDMQQSPSGKMR